MVRNWISFTMVSLLLYENACQKSTSPLKMDLKTLNEEENLVYETIFTDSTFYSALRVVLKDSTEWFGLGLEDTVTQQRFLAMFPGLSKETLSAWVSANQVQYPLKNFFKISKPYVLIPRSGILHWRDQYPDGNSVIGISRVGFNTESTQALVYVSEFWAPLAATGNVFYLIKDRDKWKIQTRQVVWIS